MPIDDGPPTQEELQTIAKCMEKPEFRELLGEYLNSMNDPETKKEEEEYLKQLEREAAEGNYTMQILLPEPAFCVKCRNKAREKVYINICHSEKIEMFREDYTGNARGAMWNVPLSVGKPRMETDKKNKEIETYDAVFHPKTVQLANDSPKFMCFLVEICVEHINEGYQKSLVPEFQRLSGIQSIGKPAAQTIRIKSDDPNASPVCLPGVNTNNLNTINMLPRRNGEDKGAPVMPPPPKEAKPKPKPKAKPKPKGVTEKAGTPPTPQWKQPNYTIVHRGEICLGDAWNAKEDLKRRLPKELVVRIDLPLMGAASEADTLDVTEKKIFLQSKKHSYYLDLQLPFPIDEEQSGAKFDKSKRILTLTLPVKPPHRPDLQALLEKRQKEDADFRKEAAAQEAERQKEDDEERRQREEEARLAREEKERKARERKEAEEARQKALEELEAKMEADRLRRQEEEREIKMKAIMEKNRRLKEQEQKAKAESEAKARSEQERKEKALAERIAAEKEQEKLERALLEKEAELCLKNRFIFEID
mmetsp:Transcript_90763/g.157400  ORF Transcript_90763/g.157400 Transcript_90763/m.157400 type:complete len:534 (-) Transcript_90763:1047-2648(-)